MTSQRPYLIFNESLKEDKNFYRNPNKSKTDGSLKKNKKKMKDNRQYIATVSIG